MKRSFAAFSLVAAAVWFAATPSARADEFCVVSFNVQSGDAQIEALEEVVSRYAFCDLWGFSEVANADWAAQFAETLQVQRGAPFAVELGLTGAADRLAILYNTDRFSLMSRSELDHINVGERVRAPLVGAFQDSVDGSRFLFMVNHLYRSRAERRHEQAGLINDWAQAQSLPVIAVGDYNFDWHVPDGEGDHDAGYDAMIAGEVFHWIRPQRMLRTHCSDYNSILDFVFVAGPARDWSAESLILEAHPSYCERENNLTSDHRPVIAFFDRES